MSTNRSLKMTARILLLMIALWSSGAALAGQTQAPPQVPDEQVWQEFLTWFRAAPASPNGLGDYAADLGRQKVSKEEIERRFAVIMRMFASRPEGTEIFFDKTFNRPALTGKPEVDGFASAPSEFLLGAVKGVRPGRALDVGMGQGRNAVALARAGWQVTGFDISGQAVAAAARNAEAAGVSVTAIKADYASFDFGRDAWDLIALIFAWAPVDEPAFVERLRTSLKPGGLVVYEHFIDTAEQRHAPMVKALGPGGPREAFAGFEIVACEEFQGTGDWGGPGSNLVHLVARKR